MTKTLKVYDHPPHTVTPSIYICTKNRPGQVKTLASLGTIQGVILVVEPQEYDDYKQAYPNVIVLVLKENNRGLMYSRQAALEHARESGVVWFWLLDDDIEGFYQRIGGKVKRVSGRQVLSSVVRSLVGSNAIGQAALEYSQYIHSAKKPVTWNSYCDVCVLINAKNTGRKKINFRVNEQLNLKGDRDFTMQCLARGLKTVRFTRYGFRCPKNGTNKGGLFLDYARGRESIEVDYLISIWGKGIVSKIVKKDGRLDAKINWKYLCGTI